MARHAYAAGYAPMAEVGRILAISFCRAHTFHMASEWMGEPIAQVEGPDDAARQLAERDRLHGHSDSLEPPRAYAVLKMWTELAAVIQLGAIALVFSAASTNGSEVLQPSIFALIILTVTGNPVLEGAKERFRVRSRKTSAMAWLAIGIGACTVAASMVASLADLVMPWWIAVVATSAMVALTLPVSLLQVMRASPAPATARRELRLDRPVRITTIGLAAVLGLMTACIGIGIDSVVGASLSLLGSASVVVAAIASLAARGSGFGPHRMGYLWGTPQWTAFGICTTLVVTTVILRAFTTVVGPTSGIAAGVIVTSLLLVAAFLPTTRRAEE